MALRSIASLTVSFGLVAIPVKLCDQRLLFANVLFALGYVPPGLREVLQQGFSIRSATWHAGAPCHYAG